MKYWFAILVAAFVLGGCISRVHVDVPVQVCDHIKDRADRATCEERVTAAARTQSSPDASPGIPIRSSMPLSLYMLWLVAYYGIGLIIARWVFIDARARSWLAFRIRPVWWAVICVIDPALGILAYWLIHYSRLVPRIPGSNNTLERTNEG
jgi:hypothetical protein